MNANQLVEDIEAIRASISRLEKRKEPASLEEVKVLGNRPIELNAREVARLLLPELQKNLLGTSIPGISIPGMDGLEKVAQRIERAADSVPRQVKVTGDVYGFTSWKAALVYGIVLLVTVAVAWYTCQYYQQQAQEKVIYQQAMEVVKERNYYYQQIQDYKQKYPKYQGLFPEYDDQGGWKKYR